MRLWIVVALIGLGGGSACERAAGSEPADGAPYAGEWRDGPRLAVRAEGVYWLPCAAAGAGENVVLGGGLELVEQSLPQSSGVGRRLRVRPDGLTAIGVETGDRYIGTGAAHDHFLGGQAATEVTLEDLFRLRSSGSAEPVYYRLRAQLSTGPGGGRVLDRLESSIQCD